MRGQPVDAESRLCAEIMRSSEFPRRLAEIRICVGRAAGGRQPLERCARLVIEPLQLNSASVEKSNVHFDAANVCSSGAMDQKPQTKGLTDGDPSMRVFLRTLLLVFFSVRCGWLLSGDARLLGRNPGGGRFFESCNSSPSGFTHGRSNQFNSGSSVVRRNRLIMVAESFYR
jgi:hypothetical protein